MTRLRLSVDIKEAHLRLLTAVTKNGANVEISTYFRVRMGDGTLFEIDTEAELREFGRRIMGYEMCPSADTEGRAEDEHR
jgi:hypothetical protein